LYLLEEQRGELRGELDRADAAAYGLAGRDLDREAYCSRGLPLHDHDMRLRRRGDEEGGAVEHHVSMSRPTSTAKRKSLLHLDV
jgi:hypothetical protein